TRQLEGRKGHRLSGLGGDGCVDPVQFLQRNRGHAARGMEGHFSTTFLPQGAFLFYTRNGNPDAPGFCQSGSDSTIIFLRHGIEACQVLRKGEQEQWLSPSDRARRTSR